MGKVIIGIVILMCSLTSYASSYSIIVASDPQPWRLDTGDGNSQSNKGPWDAVAEKVSASLKKMTEIVPIELGLINGDLTEYGRVETFVDFQRYYDDKGKIGFPIYYSLGNHDYANNVENCVEGPSLTDSDGCAEGMINAVYKQMSDVYSQKKNYSVDFKYTPFSEVCDNRHFCERKLASGSGSLAYSWDEGDIHFIQLHNYPNYTKNIGRFEIKSSLPWLKSDIEKASKNNKKIIISFHDSNDHFKDTDEFVSLINHYKYNVVAVFAGHNHMQETSNFDDIPVFISGALFEGDYYRVDIDEEGMTVIGYNGLTGTPTPTDFKERVDFKKQEQGTISSCGIWGDSVCSKPVSLKSYWPSLLDSDFGYGFDTALSLTKSNVTYLFRGKYYRKFDLATKKPLHLSLSIYGSWNGLAETPFSSGINSAFTDADETNAYLIKGNDVAVYNLKLNKTSSFTTVEKLWPELYRWMEYSSTKRIDAAFNSPDSELVVIFSGKNYVAMNVRTGALETGRQLFLITDLWHGLENTDYANGVTAAIVDKKNGTLLLYNKNNKAD